MVSGESTRIACATILLIAALFALAFSQIFWFYITSITLFGLNIIFESEDIEEDYEQESERGGSI